MNQMTLESSSILQASASDKQLALKTIYTYGIQSH